MPISAAPRALLDNPSGSLGQDTVMVAVFNDSVFWMFGDTVCPRSALLVNPISSARSASCVTVLASCVTIFEFD